MPPKKSDDSSVCQKLSNWLQSGISKASFVGELPELIDALKNLQKARGYEALENLLNRLMSKGSGGTAWEEIEHAFAVAKEAYYFKRQGLEIELEKSLGEKDQKKPDFRFGINGKWIYVEVKISSMFPGERIFLDKALNSFENKMRLLQLPYKVLLVFRYEEDQITKKMPVLLTDLEKLSKEFSSIHKKDIRSTYMFLNNEAALLMIRHPSPLNIEKLLKRYTDLTDFIDFSMVSQKLRQNRRFLVAIDANIPRKTGDIFATIEEEGMLIGRLSFEMEKERLSRILKMTLGKIPTNAPYVVTIYSREAILRYATNNLSLEILSQGDFREISGVILDVESAKSSSERSLHRRTFFENPNPSVKLDAQAIEVVRSTLQSSPGA